MCKIPNILSEKGTFWNRCKWIGFRDPIRIKWKQSWIYKTDSTLRIQIIRRKTIIAEKNEEQMNFLFDGSSTIWLRFASLKEKKKCVRKRKPAYQKGRALLDHRYSCSTHSLKINKLLYGPRPFLFCSLQMAFQEEKKRNQIKFSLRFLFFAHLISVWFKYAEEFYEKSSFQLTQN